MTSLELTLEAAAPETALEFPESDGQPMGETGIHVKQIMELAATLINFLREQANVYIGANMFMYWDATDPTEVVAPDVFVVFDIAPGERRTWKTWVEGKAPDVIFEITSKKTRREDTRIKPAIYAELKVQEYFRFDPEGDYLKPPLQGQRLGRQGYADIPVKDDALSSEVLGLELRLRDARLRLFDPRTNAYLPTPVEDHLRALEAEARVQAAEAEAARLRAELEKLRGAKK
ncbi:MAG: Uma2 family endonuclease [Chloroflexi bacterium]|nr:Uma2 family endonuclease [Chloroflexota bacterium]